MLSKTRLTFVLILIASSSFAQFSRTTWKRQRKEIYLGIGASNFLGDLGGKDKVGTDYSYADLELSLTHPSLSLGYRYRITKAWSWKSDLYYLYVSGSDAYTNEPVRNNRNLSFKSNIYELSTNIEYDFIRERGGNRYGIRSAKSRYKSANFNFFVAGGIGVFYFNPKASYHGVWYDLQPLGTEGQGLPGNPPKYKRISICIPITAGLRVALGKYYTMALEYNFRKTFTDYIDDVHSVYYDNYALGAAHGPVGAYLADPNLGNIPGATYPDAYGTPAQRGDKQMDSYMSIQLKLGIILKTKPKRRNSRAKF